MTERDRSAGADWDAPEGLSTRAIRAASRTPRVTQQPTSVPIYQTTTAGQRAAEAAAALPARG